VEHAISISGPMNLNRAKYNFISLISAWAQSVMGSAHAQSIATHMRLEIQVDIPVT
jgi:hypothetical protein